MLSDRVGRRWIFRTNPGWLGGHRHEDMLALVVCGALIIGGIPMTLAGAWDAHRVLLSWFWPTTAGHVVSVRMDNMGPSFDARWQPRVVYSYRVGGRSYVSTQLSRSGPIEVEGWDHAAAYRTRYAPNTPVTVHYNSAQPSEAVTEYSLSARTARSLTFGVGCCLLGVTLLLLFDLMRR
jgi:hypothetical protein